MCVKCIVDSGHNSAIATLLATETTAANHAIQFMTDPANHVELTDAEQTAIIDLSQKMCDWAKLMYQWVEDINNTVRPIAIAHSYPNKR